MGYTHYFEFKVPKGIKAAILESRYQTAIRECSLIARTWNRECKASGDSDSRLSGYTAHCKPSQNYGGIELNGKGENAHESFNLREHFKQNFEGFGKGFAFCKTARKPYDSVIVACLSVLKHRLGNAVRVSSDGDSTDWESGVNLARRITKLKIQNPIESLESDESESNVITLKVRVR